MAIRKVKITKDGDIVGRGVKPGRFEDILPLLKILKKLEFVTEELVIETSQGNIDIFFFKSLNREELKRLKSLTDKWPMVYPASGIDPSPIRHVWPCIYY